MEKNKVKLTDVIVYSNENCPYCKNIKNQFEENEVSFEEYIKPLHDRWSKFWPEEDQRLIHHAEDYGYFLLEAKSHS